MKVTTLLVISGNPQFANYYIWEFVLYKLQQKLLDILSAAGKLVGKHHTKLRN